MLTDTRSVKTSFSFHPLELLGFISEEYFDVIKSTEYHFPICILVTLSSLSDLSLGVQIVNYIVSIVMCGHIFAVGKVV